MTDARTLIERQLDELLDGDDMRRLQTWIRASNANADIYFAKVYFHRCLHEFYRRQDISHLLPGDADEAALERMASAWDGDEEASHLLAEALEQERRANERKMAQRAVREERHSDPARGNLPTMCGPVALTPVRHLVIPKAVAYGALAAMVALVVALMWRSPQEDPTVATDPPPEHSAFVLGDSVEAVWAAEGLPGGLFEGQSHRLDVRRLVLQSGFVELRSLRGASLVIEGPAVFETTADERLRLIEGRLAAHCPDDAAGLVIDTSRGAITDLGTRFGVAILPDQSVETHVFEGSVDWRDGAREPQVLRRGQAGRMPVDGVFKRYAAAPWQFIQRVDQARDDSKGVRLVPFDADTDYLYRDSYLTPSSTGGGFVIEDGALRIQAGRGNAATVFLPSRAGVLEVGDVWAVDCRSERSPTDELGTYVVISSDFVHPGNAKPNFVRRGASGLLVRRTSLEGRVLHTVRVTGDNERSGVSVPDPGGEVTIIIERRTADRFAFFIGVPATGALIDLGEVDHHDLASHADLCLGFEAYSVTGDSSVRFANLRKLEQVELWKSIEAAQGER